MTPLWLTGGHRRWPGCWPCCGPTGCASSAASRSSAASPSSSGSLQSIVLVTPPGATAEVRPWPGQATLLLGLALIAMAAIAVDGLRTRLRRGELHPRPADRPGRRGRRAAGAGALGRLVRRPASTRGAQGARVVRAGLRRGRRRERPGAPHPGRSPTTRPAACATACSTGPGPVLGDAETGPPAAVWEALDPYVAAMASGRGGDEIEALAGYGIRYVVLAPRDVRATSCPPSTASPGLRRLSNSEGEVLWRVAGVDLAGPRRQPTTSRPRSASPPTGTVTADPYIDQADARRRRRADARDRARASTPGWRAVVRAADGTTTDLAAVAGPGLLAWSQGFEVARGHARGDRDASTTSPRIALAVAAVRRAPRPRRHGPARASAGRIPIPDLDDDDGPDVRAGCPVAVGRRRAMRPRRRRVAAERAARGRRPDPDGPASTHGRLERARRSFADAADPPRARVDDCRRCRSARARSTAAAPARRRRPRPGLRDGGSPFGGRPRARRRRRGHRGPHARRHPASSSPGRRSPRAPPRSSRSAPPSCCARSRAPAPTSASG